MTHNPLKLATGVLRQSSRDSLEYESIKNFRNCLSAQYYHSIKTDNKVPYAMTIMIFLDLKVITSQVWLRYI